MLDNIFYIYSTF